MEERFMAEKTDYFCERAQIVFLPGYRTTRAR